MYGLVGFSVSLHVSGTFCLSMSLSLSFCGLQGPISDPGNGTSFQSYQLPVPTFTL